MDAPSPHVGIFWGVRERHGPLTLVRDVTPVLQGEHYGEFLTHARGHMEVWQAWRALGSIGLLRHGLPASILWTDYDDYPRGRVVYHEPTQRYTVYADRMLHDPNTIRRILALFGLNAQQTDVKLDQHYRSGADARR